MKIPITKPFFGPEEAEAILKPLNSGWVVQGPFVKQFEDSLASYMDARFCVATSSCTTALHLAMAILGVKPGDEVIVPAFTWVSTANVVEYMGATPVFCDIDIQTFNLAPSSIEAHVTENTVGIIPVHLFGLCADMRPILDVAERHNLWVVEDAACALGAWCGEQHAGTMGDMGAFSFHPRKCVTTGEGGLLTTAREDYSLLASQLRDHGANRTDIDRHHGAHGFLLPEFDSLGYNYRMTDLQASLGCVQVSRLGWVLAERNRRANRYLQNLSGNSALNLPRTPAGYTHGWQSFVCLFSPEPPSLDNVEDLHSRRNRLMAELEERGIATRQGTHAPGLQTYYKNKYGLSGESFPKAYIADRLTLSLPLYPHMTDEEQDYVCSNLKECIDA